MIPGMEQSEGLSLEILAKIHKGFKGSHHCEDYLATIQNGNLSPGDREKLMTWIYNIGGLLQLTESTIQAACKITDSFLKSTPANPSLHKLVGAASISLSIKASEVVV